jgi:hypothetical protein
VSTPIKRARLRAYVNALADIIAEIESSAKLSREKAVEILKKSLSEVGVEPFRGIKFSNEVYEKELISLYIVAKNILRLPTNTERTLGEVFQVERLLDGVVRVLLSEYSPEKVREVLGQAFGTVDEVVLSKVVRYIATSFYLDVLDEREAVRAVGNLVKALPEFREEFKRIAKFFQAVVIGSKVISGEVGSKVEMDLARKALAISLGLSGGAPSAEYLADVVKIVYGKSIQIVERKSRQHIF